MLMLSVAKLRFDHNAKPNRHAFHDVGLAVGNLIVQATALGLFAHQMAGFSADKAREHFNIPNGYDPVAAIAIGYLGDPKTLAEDFREREAAPRSREALTDLVFSTEWGKPADLFER